MATFLIVDDDVDRGAHLRADLEHRFGADYAVAVEQSAAAASALLDRWRRESREVALVIAAPRIQDCDRAEFLATVHEPVSVGSPGAAGRSR